MKAFENYIKRKNQPLYALAKSSEKKETKCTPEVYYDSVYSIETAHIQVFYTMTGPHATTKAFAKATATSMEEAWDFYINKHKMREPKGPSVSLHFLQEVKNGLYPIEIVDLEQVRGHKIGDYFKNFGVTEPLDDFGFSQIFMENDFYYGSSKNENKDTIFVDEDTCLYAKSTIELRNIAHNFAYTDEWAKGIRLTYPERFHDSAVSHPAVELVLRHVPTEPNIQAKRRGSRNRKQKALCRNKYSKLARSKDTRKHNGQKRAANL